MAHKVLEPKQFERIDNDGKGKFSKKTKILVVIVILIIISSTLMILLLSSKDEFKFSKIEIYPENPTPNDIITFTVHTEGSIDTLFSDLITPYFSFDTFFHTGSSTHSGGNNMEKTSENVFEIEIGPYSDGTQIWYFITHPTTDGFIIEEGTLDIGKVQYSDDVWIFDADYTPKNLENIEQIKVTAKFGNNSTVNEPIKIHKQYKFFYINGKSSYGRYDFGEFNQTSGYIEYSMLINYTNSIMTSDGLEQVSAPFPPGTVIFYRFSIENSNYKYATDSFMIQIP